MIFITISIMLTILPSILERASSCTEYMKNPARDREATVLNSNARGELFILNIRFAYLTSYTLLFSVQAVLQVTGSTWRKFSLSIFLLFRPPGLPYLSQPYSSIAAHHSLIRASLPSHQGYGTKCASSIESLRTPFGYKESCQ